MSLVTVTYLLLIAGVLLASFAGLVWIINSNFRTGRRIREVLAERIKLLRLGRMLIKRGINAETYLHEAAFHDIEANIRNCESCGKVNQCEASLGISAAAKADLSFCPNDKALNEYSKTLQ